MTQLNTVRPSILERAYPYYKKANREKYPNWFSRLNNISLLPIFLWPLIFFGSIFLFDNPQNFLLTFAIFILMNSYPLLFLTLSSFSYRLFMTKKFISVSIPILTILGWTILLFYLFKDG
jgi:hypothetical protein